MLYFGFIFKNPVWSIGHEHYMYMIFASQSCNITVDKRNYRIEYFPYFTTYKHNNFRHLKYFT